jgi:3-hydroxyisobutyrate dehydrogenase-like beta-hydroxyacid dehydrogenase
MGAALAERLLGAGFALLGYDVERGKADALNIEEADSVAEIGRRCDRVVIAVFDDAQVEEVVAGLLSAGRGDLSVLCVTTCTPGRIASLATHIRLVEAPISGTSAQVRSGEGVGFIAGETKAIDRMSDLLNAICPRRIVVGKPGDAAKAKLAVNLVLQLNRAALAEGLAFAERMGLPASMSLQVMRKSAAYSAVMDSKGEKMVRGDYAPQSRLAQTLKDAQLILEEAERQHQVLPLMRTNVALLSAAIAIAGAEADPAAIIEALRAP